MERWMEGWMNDGRMMDVLWMDNGKMERWMEGWIKDG